MEGKRQRAGMTITKAKAGQQNHWQQNHGAKAKGMKV